MKHLIAFLTITAFAFATMPSEPAPAAALLRIPAEPDVRCLTTAIYHEARGEPEIGQQAVAHVVLNRTRGSKWPSKICEVVYQPFQFTDIEKAKPDLQSSEWKTARRIAILALEGRSFDPTSGATFYFAHNKIAEPKWAKAKNVLVRLFNHTFLGEKHEKL